MKGILIIEDDPTYGPRLAQSFQRKGYRARAAPDGRSGLSALRIGDYDAVVVDLRLQGESGLSVVGEVRARHPELPVVVVTGYGSIATAKEALRLGAVDYLTKPVDAARIEQALGFTPAKPETAEADPAGIVPSLQRVEWEHLQRVLSDSGGNVSEAARRLGIERRTLQRKLSKYPPAS
jgi:two-component system response regulator RegA